MKKTKQLLRKHTVVSHSREAAKTKTFILSNCITFGITLLSFQLCFSQSLTFDDEFNTLSLHHTWQQGDLWQLIAPDSPDGRGGPHWGEGGSQWWVNPYNRNTPINGIYSVSNGMLNMGLLPTPSAYQSYIDQQAGAHMPYVGGILNTSQTNYQHYGYWNIGMACDKVPGFSCEISIENVQVTGHWPPQINIGVSTDGNGNQTVQAAMHDNSGSHNYSAPINGTVQHNYGIDWESDYITFYVDCAKIFQVPNPGGVYQADKQFVYLYTGANYSSGTGVNPPLSALPAYAHIDYFRIYSSKPSCVTTDLQKLKSMKSGEVKIETKLKDGKIEKVASIYSPGHDPLVLNPEFLKKDDLNEHGEENN